MTAAFQLVHDAERQRIVGRDYGISDVFMRVQPIAHRLRIAIVYVYKFGKLAYSRVALHRVNLIYFRRFSQRLYDGMLSAAVADN